VRRKEEEERRAPRTSSILLDSILLEGGPGAKPAACFLLTAYQKKAPAFLPSTDGGTGAVCAYPLTSLRLLPRLYFAASPRRLRVARAGARDALRVCALPRKRGVATWELPTRWLRLFPSAHAQSGPFSYFSTGCAKTPPTM